MLITDDDMRGTRRIARPIATGLWPVIIASLLASSCVGDRAAGLSAAREWALATSALLTARNKERHDTLGGQERTETTVREARDLLDRWWNAPDREGLLRSLAWIEREGHRMEFAQFAAELARLSPAKITAIQADSRLREDLRRRIAVVAREYGRLGGKGLIGWDYARYVSLCRWGYLAGYLSEEEAWARIMPAARHVQATFGSWRELGENYLIGREFWSPAQMAQDGQLYHGALQQLLTDPQSPWVRLPWQTSLGAG